MREIILKGLLFCLILTSGDHLWAEENAYFYFSQGEKYRLQENYNKAIEMYNQAIKLKPDYDLAYNNLGCAYYEKERYDDAITAYKKALEIEPNSKITHSNLGCAYYNKGMYEEALEEFKKELKNNPDYVDAINGIGCVYYNKGMYEEAIKWCKKALEINPNCSPAKERLSSAEKILGDRKSKENYSKWYNSGIDLVNQKRWKEAIEAFNKALEYALLGYEKEMAKEKIKEVEGCLNNDKLRENYRKYYNLGIEHLEQKRWQEASDAFNKALEYASFGYEKEMAKEKIKEVEGCLNNDKLRENYRKYYNLGIEHLEQKRWQEASDAFNKALEYASFGYEKEMLKEKIKEVEGCLNNDRLRENYRKYYNLGIEHLKQKRWQEAIEAFNKALEYASFGYEKEMIKEKLKETKINLSHKEQQKNCWKWYSLGLEVLHQKRFKEAAENFNKALGYASNWDEKGKVRQKLKEAKIGLERKNQQQNYQKWYNSGMERLQQNRFKEAVENFNQALKYTTTDSEKAMAKEKLKEAKINLTNERQIRAVASLKNTLPLNPEFTKQKDLPQKATAKSVIYWISLYASFLLIIILLFLLPQFDLLKAKIYLWQKRYYKIASIYEKAILKDKKIWLYPELADIYLKLDRMDDEAMKVYDRAIYLYPNNLKLLNIVADYYIKKNKTGERAREIYEEALKFNSDNIPLLNILGKIYSHQGDDKKATNVYQKLYQLGKKDEIVIKNLAKNYLKENRLDDEAILIYEEGLKYEPDNHDLIIALSQAYINKGMNDKKTVEIYRKSVGLCSNMVKTYKEKNELEKARQYAEIAYKIVYCYSMGVVNTLVRDSVIGVLNKL